MDHEPRKSLAGSSAYGHVRLQSSCWSAQSSYLEAWLGEEWTAFLCVVVVGSFSFLLAINWRPPSAPGGHLPFLVTEGFLPGCFPPYQMGAAALDNIITEVSTRSHILLCQEQVPSTLKGKGTHKSVSTRNCQEQVPSTLKGKGTHRVWAPGIVVARGHHKTVHQESSEKKVSSGILCLVA